MVDKLVYMGESMCMYIFAYVRIEYAFVNMHFYVSTRLKFVKNKKYMGAEIPNLKA